MMNTTANVTRKSALSTAIEVLSSMTEYAEVTEKLQAMLATEENRKSSPKKPKELTPDEVNVMEAIEAFLSDKPEGETVKVIRDNVHIIDELNLSPSKVTSLLKKIGAEPVKVTKTTTKWTLTTEGIEG